MEIVKIIAFICLFFPSTIVNCNLNGLLQNLNNSLMTLYQELTAPIEGTVLVSTAHDGETIIRKYFVDDILGMPEFTFRKQYGWSNADLAKKHKDANGHLTKLPFDIQNLDTTDQLPQNVIAWIQEHPRRAALFQGEFNYQTVEQLGKIVRNAKKISHPRFTLRLHNPKKTGPTDIRFLQEAPENKYASFQIASTFFGPLEGGIIIFDNPVGYVSEEKKGMFAGAAQGEEASISAGGATLFRKYFMPTQRINQGNQFGYYYLLHNIGEQKLPWGIFGHYATIDKNAARDYYPAFIKQDPKAFNADVAQVGIGNHTNVVVTSGYSRFRGVKPSPDDEQEKIDFVVHLQTGKIVPEKTQLINQIFTAAYNLPEDHKLNQETLARMVLQGSYQGTVRAAYLNAFKSGQNKLFLTLMGAGAFGNDITWVGEAITRVKDEITNFGLDVILLYRPDAQKKHRTFPLDQAFILNMIGIMDDINGTHLKSNRELKGYIDNYLKAAFHKPNPNTEQEAFYAQIINEILSSQI